MLPPEAGKQGRGVKMAEDKANPIKPNTEQGNPAKAITSKLKQIGPDAQQAPDNTNTAEQKLIAEELHIKYGIENRVKYPIC